MLLTSTNIIILSLILLNIIIGLLLLRTELRLKKLFQGKKISNLETLLSTLHKDVQDFHIFKKESIAGMQLLNEKIVKSIRGVGLVRFNPFKGKGFGGDQSFASVFLNDDGDGVIISSIYSRDRVSTYAKPIKNFESTYDLSTEEQKVITNVKKELL